MPIYFFGSNFLFSSNHRTGRPTQTMARVGAHSYLRHGIVLHRDAHRILHGQWQKLAGLEGPSERRLLADPQRSGSTSYRARRDSIP